MSEPFLIRGTVRGAHGIQGALKVSLNTDFPERILEAETVTLRLPGGELREYRTKGGSIYKGTLRLKLAEVADRDAAEALRGAEIVADPAELPPLPAGEYYWHQLLGLQVVTVDGRELGPIQEILETGSNDVYVTPTVLIPALKTVIEQVDLEAGVMTIRPLPGLLPD